MSPSRPFILRPIATSLLMAAILLVGIVAFTQLPISALPQVDYPTIQVLTFYPGASPDVVASTVTAPLEREFGEMPGLSQMTSTSAGGVSVIVMQFSLTLNLDVAEQQVQAAINSAQSLLPANLPTPPIYNKTNPADAPILTLGITSKSMPLSVVEDLIDTRFAPKLSQVSGVGLVTISGGQKPAVRIEVNPTRLAAYGIGLESVRSALTAASVNMAKGNFDGPHLDYQIDSNDQITEANEYNNVVVSYQNGAPVLLKDVAQVVSGVENENQAAWMNNQPAIIVNVQRQPGANTIAVVRSIKASLPELEASLPTGIKMHVLTDMTESIQASVHDVEFELMLTIGLVVLVIFLFLRSFYATLIPSVAVPLSLIGTFAVMYLLGYSLDNLSLMALTISTGFVVDDAIVMIENISRFLEEGDTPMQAALKGSGQIGFTILSLTVSLIAVLIPLLFMGDIVGRLFREFAVTLAVTILISAVVSLTLTPMMCSRILRHDPKAQQGRFYRISERAFVGLISFYGRTLKWVLRFQPLTLLVAAATLGLTVFLYIVIPKGFFPTQDTGVIQGITQAPPSISFDAMAKRQQEVAKIVLEDPAVKSLSSFIGVDGINTTLNTGRMSINLKPISERANASVVIRRLQQRLSGISGIHLYMQPVQDITVDDRVSRTQYQYTLEDPNQQELNEYAARFMAKLQTLPQLADIATDQLPGGRAIDIDLNRVTASRLGISPSTVDNTLYDAYGQRQINTLYTSLNQYHVILETLPQWRENPANLADLYIPANASAGASGPSAVTSYAASGSSAAGSNATTTAVPYTPSSGVLNVPANLISTSGVTMNGSSLNGGTYTGLTPNSGTSAVSNNSVPLGVFATIHAGTEMLSINHQGQFPSVTLSFNLAPGASLSGAISSVDHAADQMDFPASLVHEWAGTAEAFKQSLTNQALLILAALIVVYIVLGVLYESFIHPLTILSTLPSAGVGALLALMIFHQNLDVVAIIGIILLIGIVQKNGILIVDFALEAERTRGLGATEAIYEACLLRFRPIMMTTMAALFGGLPLALGHGYGAELRRPLGIAMVGGLLLSQVLTLYTTPVIYIFFHAVEARLNGRRPGQATPSIEAAASPSTLEVEPDAGLS